MIKQSKKLKSIKLLTLYSAVFGLMSLETYAQEVFGIKGTVTDTTGALIESGSVILLSPNDSTVLKGTHFWDGKFELLGVENTDVILKVEAFEYTPYYERKMFTPDTDAIIDLGQITLKTMIQSLDEVNIIYRIPMFEREVGKLVVNVEGTILSDKGTLVDVLKSAPNIIVKSNGEVVVVGKGTAILYLDGQRVNSLDMLSAISSRDVHRIDIIENPSAKYDAEGNAVLEIITKKGVLNGYRGSMYIQGMKQTNYLTLYGGNFSFRKDWFSAYVAGAHQIGTFHFEDNYHREIFGTNGISTDNTILTDEKHKFDAGILVKTEYRLDLVNTLFLNYNGINHEYENSAENMNLIQENDTTSGSINSVTKSAPIWRMKSFSGGYNRVIDTLGSNFEVSAQYTKFDFENTADITQITNMGTPYESVFSNQSFSKINVITGQMDYSKVFNEKIKLDFGIKNSYVTNESEIEFLSRNSGVWETDSSLFNQFDYKENIAASYAEISGRLNKISYNFGLRYEWTVAQGNSFVGGENVIDRNYMNIFPNLQLTYDISHDLVIGASYVSRINRPSYQDLDPFINFIDSLTSIKGNPQLLPSTSHAIDASLVYMEYASLKIGYTKAYNPIFMTVEQNPGTNTFSAITRNIESSELYNISIVIPYELKWWTTFNSFGYTWNNYVYKDNSVPTVNTKPSLYVSLYNEFRIPKLFNIEITYEWTSPGAQGIFIMRPYQTLNASVKRDFLEKKLTVRLSVFDAAFTQIESGFYRSSQFYVDYNSRMDTRRIQLSLTWTFGKMKDQTLVGSSIDSEEKDRIKE